MATNTTNLQLTKPAPDDYYDIGVGNANLDKIDNVVGGLTTTVETLESDVSSIESSVTDITAKLETVQSGSVLTAESTDCVAYTITDSNITRLTVGMKITIKPNMTSTNANVTLNINNTGAKYIRQRLPYNTSVMVVAPTDNWLVANKPIEIMYDGENWVTTFARTDANSMYGTLPANKVGAGTLDGKVVANTTAASTLTNVQVRNIVIATSAPTSGVNDGDIWLSYSV